MSEKTKDLGTYHLKVEFTNDQGYLEIVNTGSRYTHGDTDISPLGATRIAPLYDDMDDMIGNLIWMNTEGSFSCEENRRNHLCRSKQEEYDEEKDYGAPLVLLTLTLINSDGTEEVIWDLHYKTYRIGYGDKKEDTPESGKE